MERPTGAAVYASYILDLLRRSCEVEVVGPEEQDRAQVVLSLDGRFRAAGGRRSVTAVLDVGHLFRPRGYGLKGWLHAHWRTTRAVRSDHLLVPSTAVQLGLERYLMVNPRRITVLPPLPAPRFRRPPREQVEALRRRWGLSDRYVLFVGVRSRRKNLELLAETWRRASPRLPGLELVLAGPGRGGVPGARDLGYVEEDLLPPLIAGAVAWLNPSHFEGSAIGALEAMACGTPPLVSATGAQPRVVGPAGLVLDPTDAMAWVEALVAVSRDDELRTGMVRAALKAVADLRRSPPDPEPLLAALRGDSG
jgi:glycosyltransferase involved in cell wall biosynthesis